MSFIETATGRPDRFVQEASEAFRLIEQRNLTGEYQIFADVGFILELKKLLGAGHQKAVGAMSLRVNLAHGAVFIQAVNGAYARHFPLPWVVAAERPRTSLEPNIFLQTVMQYDIPVCEALYRPTAAPKLEAWRVNATIADLPPHVAEVWRKMPVHVGSAYGVPVELDLALGKSKVSPQMRMALNYPWRSGSPTAVQAASVPLVEVLKKETEEDPTQHGMLMKEDPEDVRRRTLSEKMAERARDAKVKF